MFDGETRSPPVTSTCTVDEVPNGAVLPFPVTRAAPVTRKPSRIAFTTRGAGGRTLLWVTNADGTRTRSVALPFELDGAPAWTPDGRAGIERQLTQFGPAVNIRDFDITPDGRQLVIEQVQEHSDVVLIELNR